MSSPPPKFLIFITCIIHVSTLVFVSIIFSFVHNLFANFGVSSWCDKEPGWWPRRARERVTGVGMRSSDCCLSMRHPGFCHVSTWILPSAYSLCSDVFQALVLALRSRLSSISPPKDHPRCPWSITGSLQGHSASTVVVLLFWCTGEWCQCHSGSPYGSASLAGH